MSTRGDYGAAATTLLMILAACYTLYPRAMSSVTEFPRESRILSAFVLLCGLCTCFIPVFKTSPAVLGRTEWSPFNLLREIKSGQLEFSPVVFDLAVTYSAMIAGVFGLLLPRPRKTLLAIAVVAALCSAWAVNMADDLLFHRLKTGNGLMHVRVRNASAAYAIEIVIAVLFWIIAE